MGHRANTDMPLLQLELERQLSECIIAEFTQLLHTEEDLLAAWQERIGSSGFVHIDKHEHSTGGREENDWLKDRAIQCRKARQTLLATYVHRLSDEVGLLNRASDLQQRWKLTEDSAASAMDMGTPAASFTWSDQLSKWSIKAFTVFLLLIAGVAIFEQYGFFRVPQPMTSATAIFDLDAVPVNNISMRLSTALSSLENRIRSSFSSVQGFPEILQAFECAQLHVQRVEDIWVKTDIFEEPVEMALRTSKSLEEMAAGASSSLLNAALDTAAYHGVLPPGWSAQRPAVRMEAELRQYQTEMAGWKQRAADTIRQGAWHLAQAQREVSQAQNVWLPMAAADAESSRSMRVRRAEEQTLIVLGTLEQEKNALVEEELGMVLSVMVRDDRDGRVRAELLSQNAAGLQLWAGRLRQAAQCRADPECRWI
ncbi:Hypothetical predicted protein [Lecanosticta acicola]|uniref:Uncharacterized protein n=1 Tax=Lecanosticta acicola TaxID=111012 RepID=A0AAI8Z686_9PEZI|nr:Hypothetical predicted protein [Lecanosticta acicola]